MVVNDFCRTILGVLVAVCLVGCSAVQTGSGSSQAEPTSFEVDGRIVFADQGDVFVINADGTQRTQLTEAGLNISPACSPDGQHITFHYRTLFQIEENWQSPCKALVSDRLPNMTTNRKDLPNWWRQVR